MLSCNLATMCSEAPRAGQLISYQYKYESALHTTDESSILHQNVGNTVVGVCTLSKQGTESFFQLLVPCKITGRRSNGFPEYAILDCAPLGWGNDTKSPDHAHLEKIFWKAKKLFNIARQGQSGNFRYSSSMVTSMSHIDFNEEDLPN